MTVRSRKLNGFLTLAILTATTFCYDDAAMASSRTFEPFQVEACDADVVLETKSPYYNGFEIARVSPEEHYERFYKRFARSFDIRSQGITEYTDDSGARIYETDLIIAFQPYKGSLSYIGRKITQGTERGRLPGEARYGYKYYWEDDPFKMNVSTGQYFVKPTKFKVYLAFHVRLPEWRHDVGEVSSKDREFWNGYICNLYAHEREHVEITRRHMLDGIEDTLDLTAESPSRLKSLVRKTWRIRDTKLRREHRDFDKRTHHGTKPNVEK